jgi:outer membrane protein OmpA-like peptidoglycan-associated protein
MKKVVLLFAAAMLTVSASAQFVGNKFFDNWSIGVNGGTLAPVKGGAFWKNQRAQAGIELTKQWTPVLATSLDLRTNVNTTPNKTFLDQVSEMLQLKVNFSNLFCGYKGAPRFFELEGVAGIGVGQNIKGSKLKDWQNFFASRLGLNFNFNVCDAWTVSLKPSLVYNLDGEMYNFDRHPNAQFNIWDAAAELTAGVTYHFKSSNGAHYFTKVRPYDQAEVDGLNAKINDLRGVVNQRDGVIADQGVQIAELQRLLNEARNQKPAVQVVEKSNDTKTLESVVTFRQGKSVIDAAQLPNVERVANYLKNHANAKVVIKGYASPEGSAEINAKIAAARAEAVKNALVKKYKIAANRITAEGQGVGNMFTEPDWNRVAISAIEEAK